MYRSIFDRNEQVEKRHSCEQASWIFSRSSIEGLLEAVARLVWHKLRLKKIVKYYIGQIKASLYNARHKLFFTLLFFCAGCMSMSVSSGELLESSSFFVGVA
jgi:hypothetical protein